MGARCKEAGGGGEGRILNACPSYQIQWISLRIKVRILDESPRNWNRGYVEGGKSLFCGGGGIVGVEEGENSFHFMSTDSQRVGKVGSRVPLSKSVILVSVENATHQKLFLVNR